MEYLNIFFIDFLGRQDPFL